VIQRYRHRWRVQLIQLLHNRVDWGLLSRGTRYALLAHTAALKNS